MYKVYCDRCKQQFEKEKSFTEATITENKMRFGLLGQQKHQGQEVRETLVKHLCSPCTKSFKDDFIGSK